VPLLCSVLCGRAYSVGILSQATHTKLHRGTSQACPTLFGIAIAPALLQLPSRRQILAKLRAEKEELAKMKDDPFQVRYNLAAPLPSLLMAVSDATPQVPTSLAVGSVLCAVLLLRS